MILRISSDLKTFKEVTLQPGFNVVLADRTLKSTQTDTTNGLGKSTLVDIIHFCLGSRFTSASTRLAHPKLDGVSFSLDLMLIGKVIRVTRKTSDPSTFWISGEITELPFSETDAKGRTTIQLGLAEWTRFLGQYWFAMPTDNQSKYKPSFRSVLSYFVRSEKDAFSDPFRHYRMQPTSDIQINNAFLLGLAWEDASDWQLLRDRKKVLDGLKLAAEEGFLGNLWGARGKLEADKIRLEETVRRTSADLKQFKVLSQYHELEAQADAASKRLEELSNENATDLRLLDMYKLSIKQEQSATKTSVQEIYKAAEVEFPDSVKRTLLDVEAFHRSVIENRKAFLMKEVERLDKAVSVRREELVRISVEQTRLLDILNTHGALDQYTALQQAHLTEVMRLGDVDRRLGLVKRVEQGRSEIQIESANLGQRARANYDTCYPEREAAVAHFDENAHALYASPGRLIIDISDAGFRFDAEIERKGSTGIGNMEIFCYDLTLAELWSKRRPGVTILVHDSNIFADVDDRQVAHALETAARKSDQLGFQYICMLNSDKLPIEEFTDAFVIEDFIRLRLTDETAEGGLLGIRLPSMTRKTKSKSANEKFAFS
jgi:uncharacterized protein YydD (DUF2326 family)